MKGGVEDGDVGSARKSVLGGPDRLQRGLVVERRKCSKLLDRGDDLRIDHGRFDEAGSAVDNAVADRVGLDVVVDGQRQPVFDEVALEAG